MPNLSTLTVKQLKAMAKKRGLHGYSNKNKKQLISMLQKKKRGMLVGADYYTAAELNKIPSWDSIMKKLKIRAKRIKQAKR